MGTKRSVLNQTWKLKNYDESLARALHQRLGVSEIVSRLLAIKNIQLEEAENYINPKIRNSMPNPYHLLDMEKGVDVIVDSIQNNKKIVVFGDYDVDGATSSALVKRFFNIINVNCDIYIPDRILEGYGPNVEAMQKLARMGYNTVVTVDCGTVSFEPITEAVKLGMDVVVTDHHLGVHELPQAKAVINPNRLDETTDLKHIAGVGVAFMLCVALNQKLREIGYYTENNIPEPNLMDLMDLVALGTVCDVVPLTGLNRSFVTQGLKVMQKRQNLGIRCLADVAKVQGVLEAYHLGYVIGPRINAGGRVGKASLGARILATRDEFEAQNIAKELEVFNIERKAIEKAVLNDALNQVESCDAIKNSPVLFVKGYEWHPGVIGIVASRVKDAYNRPVAVISIDNETGRAKASCRSIHGVDFGAHITEAKLNDLLVEGGGHKMAGGFTVENEKIDDLYRYFCDRMEEAVKLATEERVLEIDAMLDVQGVTRGLVEEIEKLGPYGAGNHKPLIAIKDAIVVESKYVGQDKQHIRTIISTKTTSGLRGRLAVMSFNSRGTLMEPLLTTPGTEISVAGEVSLNNGYLGFVVRDLAYLG